MKTFKLLTMIALAGAVAFMSSSVFAKKHDREKGRGTGPVVYVASQDLFYDTIVLGALPYNGTENFQLLEMDGPPPHGLITEYGPQDTGYYGGRWWVDANGNGYMDDVGEGGDVYFLCPLLGPGRMDP
jgi:hypothetical protein